MNTTLRLLLRVGKDLSTNTAVLKKNINTFINYQTFSSYHLRIGCGAINIFCLQCRAFHKTNLVYKKRKTREEKKAPNAIQFPTTSKFKEKKVVDVWKNMTVQQLGDAMGTNADHIFDVMEFVDNSIYYTKPSDVINDWKVIQDVVKKLGLRFKLVNPPDDLEEEEISKDLTRRPPAAPEDMIRRPPVVTIMGHVDHGKTTLLDHLRNSSIVDSEFGGITQHIGAFSVKLKNGDKVTFLDTPGHAAFSAMRNRGAQVTDIVVLVVAADDGVMEQTVQSINMAKEAQVPIIVAMNKIDKPQADIKRTEQMLIQQGILLESIGGDVQAVPISALKGTNIDTLIDAIILQADLMDIKADYSGLVEGVVIESSTDLHRGKLATILVDRGTLRKGAILVAGTAWARVRAMFDDTKQTVQEATPGSSVQLIGWRVLPCAGDVILEVQSEKQAQQIIKWRENNKMKEKQEEDIVDITMRNEEYNKIYKAKLEERRKLGRYKVRREGPRQKENVENDELKLNIIVKGDVDGSVEAIMDVLETYTSSLCKLDIVHYGVGSVTINDVELAETFKAIIYTFNVGTLKESTEKAKSLNINVKHHNIIYRLVDDLIEEIEKLIPPVDVEEVLGEANVLQHFIITEGKKKIPVAGCRCTKGVLKKSAQYKVLRGSEVVYQGTLESMRHLKNEVDTIKKDIECGLRFNDVGIEFLPGDTVICYTLKKVPKKLDWDPGF